jgi:hypothetical protein
MRESCWGVGSEGGPASGRLGREKEKNWANRELSPGDLGNRNSFLFFKPFTICKLV